MKMNRETRRDASWRLFPITALGLLAALATSCSLLAPARDGTPTQYFVLTEEAHLERIADLPDLHLGVGPINIPEYLQRLPLVRRVDTNRVVYSGQVRWAEPVGVNFQRVLADDLGLLLDTERLALFPWYSTFKPKRRVSIDVQRFEVDPAGNLRLWARWQLRDLDMRRLDKGDFDQSIEGPFRGDAVAAAMSRLLGELARDIAVAVAESM